MSTTPTAAATPEPSTCPDETAAAASRTKLDMEFDFNDNHCFVDVDELLTRLSKKGRKLVLADTSREKLENLDGYDWADLARMLETEAEAAEKDKVREKLESDADTIRDAIHSPECDCATLDHQWFLETVDDQVKSLFDGTRYVMGFYEPSTLAHDAGAAADHVETGFAISDLRDTLRVDQYDRLTLTLDRATGLGEICWYDRGGSDCYEIIVLTDPDRIALCDDLADTSFDQHPVALVADLTDTQVQTYQAFRDTDCIEATDSEDAAHGCTLDELDTESFLDAMKALDADTLTTRHVAEMAALSPTWAGSTRELVTVLRAAAA